MNIDFNKGNGLVPVIIQDDTTLQVLMLGYMNEEAFQKTQNEGKVTFYSRSKGLIQMTKIPTPISSTNAASTR
jgi:phosphoribosyl-ATP pyrophosphohydrolase/phosphoribosyl-AMP cyclohydrolase